MRSVRTFVAVEMPENIRRQFGEVESRLMKADAHVKWVEPHHIHITMKFLGEIDEDRLVDVFRGVEEGVRGLGPFEASLAGLGAFPNLKRPRVVWVGEWHSPPKETEAATSLINGGADVLFQNTDSPAVLKTAEAKGKRAFGWDSDMTAYGPKAHLASAVINWGPYYIKTTKEALDGSWKAGAGTHSWWGVKEGAIDIVSIAEDVPAETKAKVEEVKKGLADGSFAIWKGPITDNAGKVQVAKDSVADDKFLGGLNFYVKGVEGKVPGAK